MRAFIEWAAPVVSLLGALLSWRYFARTRRAIHDAPKTILQAARDATASDGMGHSERPGTWDGMGQ